MLNSTMVSGAIFAKVSCVMNARFIQCVKVFLEERSWIAPFPFDEVVLEPVEAQSNLSTGV